MVAQATSWVAGSYVCQLQLHPLVEPQLRHL
jgi:hypothetical protein